MKKAIPLSYLLKVVSSGECIADLRNNEAVYVITLDEDGKYTQRGDGTTFHSFRDVSEFAEDEDMDGIYNSETLENDSFLRMFNNLLDEIDNSEEFVVDYEQDEE